VHWSDLAWGMMEFFAFLPVSGYVSRYSQIMYSIDDHGSLPCFLIFSFGDMRLAVDHFKRDVK